MSVISCCLNGGRVDEYLGALTQGIPMPPQMPKGGSVKSHCTMATPCLTSWHSQRRKLLRGCFILD